MALSFYTNWCNYDSSVTSLFWPPEVSEELLCFHEDSTFYDTRINQNFEPNYTNNLDFSGLFSLRYPVEQTSNVFKQQLQDQDYHTCPYSNTFQFPEYTMGPELPSRLPPFPDSLMYQRSGVDALSPWYDCGFQGHAQVEEVSSVKAQKQDAGNEERSLSAQSLAVRARRKKISEKTQELGKLIPGGQKMNIAEMLQAAFKYVKFLEAQIGVLKHMALYPESEEALGNGEMQDLVTCVLIQEKLYTAENQRSKADAVQKIFTSVFVTNFLDGYGAKDLWNTCKLYGHVVDVFIPDKRTKAGKVMEFASLTNLKVVLGKEGYANIKLKYMGGFWVMIVFQDDETKKGYQFNLAVSSWFSQIIQAHNDLVIDKRVIWVEVEGVPCMTCWVRAIEVPGWVPDFEEDGEEGYDVNDESHKDDMYGGVSENLKDVEGESDMEEVPETNFEKVPDKSIFEGNFVRQNDVHSEDPFGVYEVLNKKRDGKNTYDKHEDSLKYPPEFTPNEEGYVPVEKVDNWSDKNRVNDGQKDGVCVGQHVHERVEISNDTHESTCSGHFKKPKFMNKLKYLKKKIRIWARLHKESLNSRKSILKAELANLDGVIDKGEGSDADGHRRREVVRLIPEVEKVDAMEVAQKAKLNCPSRVTRTRSIILNDDLEMEVSNEDIKRAGWDCGIDKAPGADGFTFGFYRRPISLIVSLYKVIAKVLANRLVTCKNKKKQSIIFKFDFEKAYDSVRWDFIDDILRRFGFGEKWYKWIQSCLYSSRGLVLVNKSPTKEFQFHKGLKQGDPLSLFLFILVMESLHVSFQRVVDAGLFNGIKLDSSLQISHLFYADDAIFMGQWSQCNIDTIIRVLDVFYRASGLRINMNKSNLMGIFVDSNKVKHATAKRGCLVLKTPFNYLGSRVGDLMSRIQSWHDVTGGMHTRLSKWKLKTLSIEGRLTLLKYVLGTIPIYHMSIFKVSMKVLQNMESIRARFFNGADVNSKKPSWVRWKSVLAAKDVGGLGVRVVKALHGEDGKIGKKVQPRYSSTWLNVINEIESLKFHAWCGDIAFKNLVPRLYALESMKNIEVASKLSHGSLEFSFTRNPRGGVEQA
nr:RNA-directed DNA polymerase, eukaryota, reverse transcriptase zinc-binding domain protein [Tanacetum cinerariifolium]